MNNKKIYGTCYGPFQLWVLNNFPFTINDFDSITQYQMLLKCLNFCKEQMDVNEDLYKKFNDLEDYVTNYFENLDVQDEIDNKLDEMALDGTLESIISAYLETKALLCFNTVNDLKGATTLSEGCYVRTLGYSSVSDGGNGIYLVRELINTDVIDNGELIPLTNYPTLVAQLVNQNTVYPEQFGAKGDSETNDNTAIDNCIKYAYKYNCSVKFNNDKIYIVDNITLDKPINVDFNNAVIRSSGDDAETSVLNIGLESDTFETKTSYTDKFNISNIYVDVNLTNRKYGVEIHVRRQRFNRIYVKQCTNTGIYVGDNDGVWIDSAFISGNNTTTISGLDIGTDDCILGNIEVAYCTHGVRVLNAYHDIVIKTLHAWCDIANSSCIKFLGSSYYADVNSLIMDSTQYGIDIASVSGLGKMHVGTITVFPSENFTSWKVVRINTAVGTQGIVIDNIYGLTDTDTTNRFTDFQGTLQSGLNYNQKPAMAIIFDEQNATCNLEQHMGLWYHKDNATITGDGDNDLWLGSIGASSLKWVNIPIYCVIYNSNYIPVGFGVISFPNFPTNRRARLRCNISLTNNTTYRFRIITPLPSGYAYSE